MNATTLLPAVANGSAPRIAIASPGVGLVQRGFERMFADLFEVVGNAAEVTLVKGGGACGPREIVPTFLPRNGRILRTLPLHWLIGRTRFHVECLSFALALLPSLRRGRFDLVHTIDPPLTRVLSRLRRRFGLRFHLLHTEATNMPPGDYPPADHIHEIGAMKYEAALRQGIPRSHLSLIPAGISPARFATSASREELRAQHGIGKSTFVVLCVAALNRWHKRVDHLVEEFDRLEGDCLLWLDGSMDHGEPDLPGWVRSRLGERCRISRVPSHRVGELYRLADVKVLASEHEAFGLVLPEAMACGLPVLAHRSSHFRWLIGSDANLVDMTARGELAARLQRLQANPAERALLCRTAETLARYDWANLKRDYLELYERVLSGPIRNDLCVTATPWRHPRSP